MENKILVAARLSSKSAALAFARLAMAGFKVTQAQLDSYESALSFDKMLKNLDREAKVEAAKMSKQTCTGRKSDRKRNRANRWR